MFSRVRFSRFWFTVYDADVSTTRIDFPTHVKYACYKLLSTGDKLKVYGFIMLWEASTLTSFQRHLPDYLLVPSRASTNDALKEIRAMESSYPMFQYGSIRTRYGRKKQLVMCDGAATTEANAPSYYEATHAQDSPPAPPSSPIAQASSTLAQASSTLVSKDTLESPSNIKMIDPRQLYFDGDELVGVKACDLPKVLDDPGYMSRHDSSVKSLNKRKYYNKYQRTYVPVDDAHDRPLPRDSNYTPFRRYCKS